jgi:hypothetical protein
MKFNWKWVLGVGAAIVLSLPFLACHSKCHAATTKLPYPYPQCSDQTPHNCE